MLASAMERGIQRGVERASAAIHAAQERTTERLTAIEGKLEQIPQYGPRIESATRAPSALSRGFPAPPNELTSIGTKLEASYMERLAELGLPKLLKKRRLELHTGSRSQQGLHRVPPRCLAYRLLRGRSRGSPGDAGHAGDDDPAARWEQQAAGHAR